MSRETVNRIAELMRMHECIIDMGDEDIYMDWITYGIPDEPSEDDFQYIAQDDELYEDTVQLFEELYAEG